MISYGPPVVNRRLFSLVEWAAKPENQEAWQTLMKNSGGQLTDNPFADIEANFVFGDAAFVGICMLSMNKARRLGWTGFVDTIESLFEMYSEMGKLGMLPKMKVDKPKPMV